jgi:putative flippase GtrA
VVSVAASSRRAASRYREPLAYLVVGAWNTAFGYAVFALLYYLLSAHLHVDVILVISYVLSIANAYVGYRWVVFRSTGSMRRELPRFSAVYLVTLAANLIVLPLALSWLPWSAYVVQGLFTVVIVALSYLGHKYFSFRGGSRPAAPSTPSGSERPADG